jgi:hypothetical protein
MRAAVRGNQELTDLLLGVGVGTVQGETLMRHEEMRRAMAEVRPTDRQTSEPAR